MNAIKRIFDDSGFSYVWTEPDKVDPTQSSAELAIRLTDQYMQTWHSEDQASSGKLKTYRQIKQDPKLDRYFELQPQLRVHVSRLRTSAHLLAKY